MPDTNFMSQVFKTIDAAINGFVENTYHHLVASNEGVITLIFTLYIIILGYRFLHDSSYQASISSVTRHLLSMLIVYALIMNWDIYNKVVYNIFTREPENLSTIIINATGKPVAGGSVLEALDSIWDKGIEISNQIFKQADFSSLQFLLYGAATLICTLLLCAYALLLFIYAKLGMAIFLALGPLFIIFNLFEATKGLTQSWIQQLINLALVPIVTSALISLMYTVINSTMNHLNAQDLTHMFGNLSAYCLISFVSFFLLLHVLPICSALSGGVGLSAIHHAGGHLREAARGLGLGSYVEPSQKTFSTKTQNANKKYVSKPTGNKAAQ